VVEKYDLLYPGCMKIVALTENRGAGFAANEGMKYCTHELVARMDSDDISIPTRFEEQLKVFADHPELAVVGGWIEEFTENPEIIDSVKSVPEYDHEIKYFSKSRNPINHISAMFRKSAVMAVGGYRDMRFCQDYDLWVRLIMNGAKFYNVQKSLAICRTGDGLFKRRGKWSYVKKDINLFYSFYKMGLYSYPVFLRNILVRFSVRLMPNRMRTFVYKTFLRK
jgi:glycosyltransferase involved in cell wall biosynthesis